MRLAYFQRETRELVNLDSCELIHSQFGLVSDYWASVALDYFAEVAEQLLPSAEPSEKFFRLLLAVLGYLPAAGEDTGRPWRAVTYFSLWAVRLAGCLPELNVCLSCGTLLDGGLDAEAQEDQAPQRAYYSRTAPGLLCFHCRNSAGGGRWELSAQSRSIAAEMLRSPVAQLSMSRWDQDTAADLRRFLVQRIESHVERRLITASMLEEQQP